jgi:hypothetical protein
LSLDDEAFLEMDPLWIVWVIPWLHTLTTLIFSTNIMSLLFLLQQRQDTGLPVPGYLAWSLWLQAFGWCGLMVAGRGGSKRNPVILWPLTLFVVGGSMVLTCLELAIAIKMMISPIGDKEPQDPWTPTGWSIALLCLRALGQTMLWIIGVSVVVQRCWRHYVHGYESVPTEPSQAITDHTKISLPTGSVGWSEYTRRMRTLLPFMWPKGDWRLQCMIVMCITLLAAGRMVNVLVPAQYKRLVDALGGDGRAPTFAWDQVVYFVGLRFLQGNVGVISSLQGLLWIPVGQVRCSMV